MDPQTAEDWRKKSNIYTDITARPLKQRSLPQRGPKRAAKQQQHQPQQAQSEPLQKDEIQVQQEVVVGPEQGQLGEEQEQVKKKKYKRKKIDWLRPEPYTEKDQKDENYLIRELFGKEFLPETDQSTGILGEDLFNSKPYGIEEEVEQEGNEYKREKKKKKIQEDETKQKQQAWVDEDDAAITVKLMGKGTRRRLREKEDESVLSGVQYADRLKVQHEKLLRQNVDWAKVDDKDEDDLEKLLRSTKSMVTDGDRLPSTSLSIKRIPSATSNFPHKGPVRSVQFHCGSQLLLTSGSDKVVKIIKLHGKRNELVHNIKVKGLSMPKAQFTPDGRTVIICGGKASLFWVDTETGKSTFVNNITGYSLSIWKSFVISPDNQYTVLLALVGGLMVLISNSSKQWVADFKGGLNTVSSAAFTPDGTKLFASYAGGAVLVWDIALRRVVHRFTDVGMQPALSMAVSEQWLATGTDSGIVNVYSMADVLPSTPESELSQNPKPRKEIDVLTTAVNLLTFNFDNQLLFIGSDKKPNAFRAIHIPSFKVLLNLPTSHHNQQTATAAAFSPKSGYLAVGVKGGVNMYRLTHYGAS